MASGATPAGRVDLRSARVDEAKVLSDLAVRSKAHWGYEQIFLEACREELTIHPGQIRHGCVVVAVRDDEIVGFYALAGEGAVGDLVDLFVEPAAIGSGVGGALMANALSTATSEGWERLRIEADPNARPFYVRYGARAVGEVPSGSIPGRMLPLLEIDL